MMIIQSIYATHVYKVVNVKKENNGSKPVWSWQIFYHQHIPMQLLQRWMIMKWQFSYKEVIM